MCCKTKAVLLFRLPVIILYLHVYIPPHTAHRKCRVQAAQRTARLSAKQALVLELIQPLEQEHGGSARFHLLRGQAFSVGGRYSAQAEESLSRAVKLDPSLVAAWNALGENFYYKNDVQQRLVLVFLSAYPLLL